MNKTREKHPQCKWPNYTPKLSHPNLELEQFGAVPPFGFVECDQYETKRLSITCEHLFALIAFAQDMDVRNAT